MSPDAPPSTSPNKPGAHSIYEPPQLLGLNICRMVAVVMRAYAHAIGDIHLPCCKPAIARYPMSNSLSQPVSKKSKLSRAASQQVSSLPTSQRPQSAISTADDATEPTRRSTRSRRPSAHKLESDAYEASSRASSRPVTPATPAAPRSNGKSKKRSRHKSESHPGRIVQPDNSAWTARNVRSPEPFTTPGPVPGNIKVARQGSASHNLDVGGPAEALDRASSFLGYDASRLSARTRKKVYEVSDNLKDAPAPSVELEGGSAPTILQSTRGVVLGSGYEPHAGPITGNVNAPERPSRLEVPPKNDTATESESEPESIELGSGDSVSQRLPFAPSSPPPLAYPSHAPSTPLADATGPVDKTAPLDNVPSESDTDTIDEDTSDSDRDADSESELAESVRALKRQRLEQPSRVSCPSHQPSPRHPRPNPSSATRHSPTHSRTTTRPLVSKPPLTSALRAAPSSTQTTSTSAESPDLSKPPPVSDPDAVLAWAVRQASRPDGSNPMLAQVLGDLRQSCLVAPVPEPHSGARQPRALLRPTDFVEDNSVALEAEALLALGKHVKRRHQPTLSDYPGYPRHVASRVIPELLALACTQGMHEVHGTFDEWSDKLYRKTWADLLPDLPLQRPDPTLRGIMVHRISWCRGDIKGSVETQIPVVTELVDPPRTIDDLRYNRKRVKKMLPNNFHCPHFKPDTKQYEHPGVKKCLAAAYFSGKEPLALRFPERFRPIPIPAVALVLTTMQHCIKEWKTGRRMSCKLNATKQASIYWAHLTGLLEYEKVAGNRLTEFREEWFKYGLAYAGGLFEGEETYCQPITRADRVRPDTPPHA